MGIRARFGRLNLSTKMLAMGAVLALWFPIPLLMWLLPNQSRNSYGQKEEATRHIVEAS